ncbi:hypothetical protein FQN60_015757 [Etheostoma spectabile]|uniref:Uncharacterized protein n=1 Tax=Etheostoma spectabile TaxID=54343 RepID=A0A5J5CV14_9PERO|nr:hypothetical protein FQN60_015757 [Etheostoma spectabile]
MFNHLLRSGKFIDLSIPSQGQVDRERFQPKRKNPHVTSGEIQAALEKDDVVVAKSTI